MSDIGDVGFMGDMGDVGDMSDRGDKPPLLPFGFAQESLQREPNSALCVWNAIGSLPAQGRGF
jgi:hypothetical protein